jgi:serine/threonine protein kinase
MPDPSAPPVSPKPDSILAGLNPDELFARGMQSVKITGVNGLANWDPPTIEEAARLFPNYEILEIIGRGGMGAVYKARQLALDRAVAIKLLPLEVSVDREFAERFKREARTMARLNHPNIVSVFDFGTTTEGHLYFVMEFVEGTTLHHLIRTTGLKPAQALEIIVGVCEALNYAHAEGIVHRDVKPANVLVDVRGRVKVTDFGLARFSGPSAAEQAGYTMTGTVLGTPDYMAPEQKRGMHVDHRADIYSLGVMLYEMLCGHVPQGVFDLPSQLVSVDERVDQVVVRAMQQEPDRRYQNTADMKQEVQTIRVAKDPRARAPRPKRIPSTSRTRTLAAAGTIVLTLAVVGAFLKFRNNDRPVLSRWSSGQAERASASNRVEPGGASPASMSRQPTAPSKSGATGPGSPAVAPAPRPDPAPASTVASTPAAPPAASPAPANSKEPTPAPALTTPPTPPASIGATTPATTQISPPSSTDLRSAPNPALAGTVAQLGPNPGSSTPGEAPPTVVLSEWERYAERAEFLMKRRDPEGAIQAYENAIAAAEESETPVPVAEIARLCVKMGGLESALGSIAEARGSLEHGKRLLLQAKSGGKLPPEAVQVLAELEGNLRRLPREQQ